MQVTPIFPHITLLLSLFLLAEGQILIPRCQICQRCSYCSSDVMYDCDIDTIYATILTKNPSVSSAFPVTITKTAKDNITTYFFQFSNSKNVTYQIIPKTATPTPTPDSGKVQAASPSNSSNLTIKADGQQTSSVNKTVISWTGLTNASQIILEYVIRHFYLSSSSTITSLTQEVAVNTYTAVVRSADSSIKMTVVINPIDFSLKVSAISFLDGSINDIQNSSKPKTTPTTSTAIPSVNQTPPQTPTQRVGITLSKGVTITPTIEQLLNYLYISYTALAGFQLDSFSTSDGTNYNLTLSSRQQPAIKYNFQALTLIAVPGNLRGMGPPSQTFQIMSYSLLNTSSPASFAPLKTPQQLYSDPYAQAVITQMQDKIIRPLSLNNLVLVNISASIPFYVLYYEMETQVFQFVVSYDVLTQQIRIIQENISEKKGTKVKSQQNAVNVDDAGLVAVKQVNNGGTVSAAIVSSKTSVNSLPSSSAQQLSANPGITVPPSPVQPLLVQVKPAASLAQAKTAASSTASQGTVSSSSFIQTPPSPPLSPIFINHRLDHVFLKAASAINSQYSFNSSNILKVSVITLSNTVNQYSIALNFNLVSGKALQFLASYNSLTNNVTLSNFTYNPPTVLLPSQFQALSLADINRNPIIMGLISHIFMAYPQFFSNAVSSIEGVQLYPPYFNITYSNSVFGMIRFDCEHNYLTNTPRILNYTVAPLASSNKTQDIAQDQLSSSSKASATVPSSNDPSPSDPFCVKSSNGVCTQCAFRFYYDKQKRRCTAVADQCSNFDYSSCLCTGCFSGYILLPSGVCQPS